MGRSGGSSGHSSGGFGSSHSTGGFSGGGRNSRRVGSSHSSRPSGFRSPPRMGGYRPFGVPIFRPPRRRRSFFGFGSIFGIFIVIIIIIAIVNGSNSSKVTNTTKRQKLSPGASTTSWYDDGIGWIRNGPTLTSGLKDFYNETGVAPYVLFVPYSSQFWTNGKFNTENADKYLEKQYKKLFSDEKHFIFAYFETANDSESEMDGEFRYLIGKEAQSVLDDEAIRIMEAYHSKNYYDTSLSTEKMISNTFSQTAKTIMSKPTNAFDFLIGILVVGGIVVGIFIIYKIIKNVNTRKKEKEEYTKQILNTPLDKFGTDTSQLEKKYEDKN